uniref:Uncharacterized protein n=1 Tax=Oryzias latipes TaxID=8090 RepID=A0A3P9IIG8_ORYLA
EVTLLYSPCAVCVSDCVRILHNDNCGETGCERGEQKVKAGYLTAYQVTKIKALGHSPTKHVLVNKEPAQRQALTFELQPLSFGGQEVTSTSAFEAPGPRGRNFSKREEGICK